MYEFHAKKEIAYAGLYFQVIDLVWVIYSLFFSSSTWDIL